MKKNFFKTISMSMVLSMFALPIIFSSCENYLDIDEYIYDRTTIDSVFASKIKLFEYINGIVAFLPNDGSPLRGGSSVPAGQADDDWFASRTDDGWNTGMWLLLDNATSETWPYGGHWGNMYKGIRKCNIALARIGECPDLTDMERLDYMGRLSFLRGYFYFSLLRHYGPIPILPNTAFSTDEEAENVMQERDTWNDCVEYICKDMEDAALRLPISRGIAAEFVPTRGAALSILARLRLYEASDWYNGNTRYSDWKRTDGQNFISQEHNSDLWGKAAAAFSDVINLGVYQLHTIPISGKTRPLPANVPNAAFPNGAGDIDPYLSYKNIFDGTTLSSQNSELIYYVPADNLCGSVGCPTMLGGDSRVNIPLDMIEQYRFADGRQYNEGTEEERSWKAINAGITISGDYAITPNTAIRDAYREPRFYATIGYNHCMWPGTAYTGTKNITNIEITYYKDGTGASTGDPLDFNHTGYTSRKFVHQEEVYFWDGPKKVKVMPVIRYAEILMGYVEAMNEMEGDYIHKKGTPDEITITRDPAKMVEYFNQIRYRAGLPGITLEDANNKERMKQLIEQERRVEFAFEVHRYYDLRRWGNAQENMTKPIYGYNVQARGSEREKFYTPIILDKERVHRRTFSQKMYFYVIPRSVLDRNRKIVQNPGWR